MTWKHAWRRKHPKLFRMEPPIQVRPPPRLLGQVRSEISLCHMSLSTEWLFVEWVRRFILFHGKRHPKCEVGFPNAYAQNAPKAGPRWSWLWVFPSKRLPFEMQRPFKVRRRATLPPTSDLWFGLRVPPDSHQYPLNAACHERKGEVRTGGPKPRLACLLGSVPCS